MSFCSGSRWRDRSIIYSVFPHCSCALQPGAGWDGRAFPSCCSALLFPCTGGALPALRVHLRGDAGADPRLHSAPGRHRPCSAGEGTPGPWRLLGGTQSKDAWGLEEGGWGRSCQQPEHPAVPHPHHHPLSLRALTCCLSLLGFLHHDVSSSTSQGQEPCYAKPPERAGPVP